MGSKKATQRPPSLTGRPCAYLRRSSAPAQPNRQPQQAMSQRMGTIYPGAPGATGRQARARSLAEHATSNTTEEANDRCRTPDDSTAEDEHSDHNRTIFDPRQAPAWAPFSFRLVSLHGARSAAGKKPPAMRVRVEGSALASKRRQSGYDTGVQVVSARKGGRFGKQGTQPVAQEVDVQVPHRVHTEV